MKWILLRRASSPCIWRKAPSGRHYRRPRRGLARGSWLSAFPRAFRRHDEKQPAVSGGTGSKSRHLQRHVRLAHRPDGPLWPRRSHRGEARERERCAQGDGRRRLVHRRAVERDADADADECGADLFEIELLAEPHDMVLRRGAQLSRRHFRGKVAPPKGRPRGMSGG